MSSLAELNEISMATSGKILTFQGHPELTSEISFSLSGKDDGTYTSTTTAGANGKNIVLEDARAPHDGQLVWKYIMDWALPRIT